MKNLAKSLMVAGAMMAAAGSASADWFDCFRPVIGVDYYQVWMKSKNTAFFNNGSKRNSSFPGITAYVGGRFADCWGFEIGYDASGRKSRNFTFSDAGLAGATTSTTLAGTYKIRRTGGHIDLIGYMPIDCFDCFELFGSIGYGYVKPKVSVTGLTATPANGTNANAFLASASSFNGKGRSVFRLGVGANYMFTDCIGVRAKVGFESTSSLKHNGALVAANGTVVSTGGKAFKSSGTLALGAFVKF